MREELFLASFLIVISGFVALELGITPVVAELLAGMLAGHLTGGVSVEIVDFLADVGILVLMYVAGLEIDLDQLHKRLKPSFFMGFSAFILPFSSLMALCHLILGLALDESLLVSIALSSTSIAIIYPLLKQSGDLDEDLRLILSAGMITELMGVSLLGLFTPQPWLFVLLILGLLVFARIFPFLGGRIFKHYTGNVAEFEFKMILLLLLSVAVVAEQTGFESAIAAFFLGMVTSEVVVQHENLAAKLRTIVFGFFAPIFFFSVGLKVDFFSIIENVPLLLIFLFVSFSATYVGAYLPSRRILPRYCSFVSSLFNSNLTIGVIIAVFGFESGILPFSVYSAMIGTIVISTTISTLLCRPQRLA